MGTTSASANGLNVYPCWKASSATTWTSIGGQTLGIAITGTQRIMVSDSATVAPGVGVYNFGLCYNTSNTNWNNNEFGYVAAQRNP